MRKTSIILLCAAQAGCTQAQHPQCVLPLQQQMALVSLYFGRNVAGRAPVSDADWTAFAQAEIAPRFPKGFTVFDAHGAWLDAGTRKAAGESTKVLQIVAPDNPDLSGRVTALAAIYRHRFNQESVLIVSSEVCTAF